MKRRRMVVLAILAAFLAYGVLAYQFNWLADDAYISFRYAKNLAAGDGLRYNVSEDLPVEGYSNFLWVLLMAPFESAGVPSPLVSRVISFICGLVLIWRLTRFVASTLSLSSHIIVASAVFFASLPPVVVWATSGLETTPVALLLFLTFEWLCESPRRSRGFLAATAAVLLLLIRADGFFWVATCIGVVTFRAMWRRDKSALRTILVCGVGALVAAVALELFRIAYFHSPLPNTAYAKIVSDPLSLKRGLYYVISLMLYLPHLLLVLLLAVTVAVRDRSVRSLVLQCTAFIFAAMAYAVIVGGDFMAMGRLLVPVMPFFAILFAIITAKMFRSPAVVSAVIGIAISASVLSVFDVNVVPRSVRKNFHYRWNTHAENSRSEMQYWEFMARNAQVWARLGRTLKEYTREGESLVQPAIGAVGYYSDLHIYDRFGLVDREVARLKPDKIRLSPGHDKFVPLGYFLKYKPTYLHASVENEYGVKRLTALLKRIGVGGYVFRAHEIQSPAFSAKKEYLCLFVREQS